MANTDHVPAPLAVDVNGATRITGTGRTTLYEAVRRGELRSCTVGRRRLFLVDDLREWLEAHADTPRPAA